MSKSTEATEQLLNIMRRLRDPQTGCPWDVEQDFASIAPYTVEEAYEVAEAISRNDMTDLREELGDLLLQVVFHAQMAEEQQLFTFADVAQGISEKLVRRHPHVFLDGKLGGEPEGTLDGERSDISSDQVVANWDAIKQAEKLARGRESQSLLDGIGAGMPALKQAEKLQRKAGKVGFDWNDPLAVIAKLREEIDEVEEAILQKNSREEQESELGDVLFCVVNLARHLDLDSDMALRRTNRKFVDRFHHVESRQRQSGKGWSELDLATLESWWVEAKSLGR